MEKSQIKAQAEAYCENPKAWRKSAEGAKAFSELPAPVQAKVRELLEGRRGFRRVNGKIEFSKDALKEQIARLKEKSADIKAKLPLIDARIAELESEYDERFGEDNE